MDFFFFDTDDKGFKILAVEERIYEILMKQCNGDGDNRELDIDESEKKENSELDSKYDMKNIS